MKISIIKMDIVFQTLMEYSVVLNILIKPRVLYVKQVIFLMERIVFRFKIQIKSVNVFITKQELYVKHANPDIFYWIIHVKK